MNNEWEGKADSFNVTAARCITLIDTLQEQLKKHQEDFVVASQQLNKQIDTFAADVERFHDALIPSNPAMLLSSNVPPAKMPITPYHFPTLFAPAIHSCQTVDALLERFSAAYLDMQPTMTFSTQLKLSIPPQLRSKLIVDSLLDVRPHQILIQSDLAPGTDVTSLLPGTSVLSFQCPLDPLAQGLKLRPLLSSDLVSDPLILAGLPLTPGTAELEFRWPSDPMRLEHFK